MKSKLGNERKRGIPLSQVKEKLLKVPTVSRAYHDHAVVLEAARFIREMRKNSGLTQEELAKRMGVSQAIIGRLEVGGGKRGMSIEMLARVAFACKQPILVQPAPKGTAGIARDHLVFAIS